MQNFNSSKITSSWKLKIHCRVFCSFSTSPSCLPCTCWPCSNFPCGLRLVGVTEGCQCMLFWLFPQSRVQFSLKVMSSWQCPSIKVAGTQGIISAPISMQLEILSEQALQEIPMFTKVQVLALGNSSSPLNDIPCETHLLPPLCRDFHSEFTP